jgi:hypothetical protein
MTPRFPLTHYPNSNGNNGNGHSTGSRLTSLVPIADASRSPGEAQIVATLDAYGRSVAWTLKAFQKDANSLRRQLNLTVAAYDYYTARPQHLPLSLAAVLIDQLHHGARRHHVPLDHARVIEQAETALRLNVGLLLRAALALAVASTAEARGTDIDDILTRLDRTPSDRKRVLATVARYPIGDDGFPQVPLAVWPALRRTVESATRKPKRYRTRV